MLINAESRLENLRRRVEHLDRSAAKEETMRTKQVVFGVVFGVFMFQVLLLFGVSLSNVN